MNIFKTELNQLRNVWWITVFFLILFLLTLPAILISSYYNSQVSVELQALIIVIVSFICQRLRKQAFQELTGKLNRVWIIQLLQGFGIGALMMLLPAVFLFIGGWVTWDFQEMNFSSLLSSTVLFMSIAIAEELLFRGFIFQRLITSVGILISQIIMAGYFLLIHMDNPGMVGLTKVFAMINIFLASILLGITYIKTRSLALPLGIHFMANWVQGYFLGFGVSGNAQKGLFQPEIVKSLDWLTGGTFGLEASLPGLVFLVIIIIICQKMKIQKCES